MDAATRRIQFALASDVFASVIPSIRDDLGVGIEVGAVLEALFRDSQELARERPRADHRERVVFGTRRNRA